MDLDEWLVPSLGQRLESICHQFLTCSAFPCYKNSCLGGGHLVDCFHERSNLTALTDDFAIFLLALQLL